MAASGGTKGLSRLRKPDGMSLEEWQIELRRSFGRRQEFGLANIGDHAVFSRYRVTNPKNQNSYQVIIRGTALGENSCSCPDFRTNTLGTCKHVEFVLARLESSATRRQMLEAGYQPRYSEIYLQYGSRREVVFRPGRECPKEVARRAADFFDDHGVLSEEGLRRFEEFVALADGEGHDLQVRTDALGFIAEVRDAAFRSNRVQKEFGSGNEVAFSELLDIPLYDYQREGALFAAQAGRCILGDDMGLGKTIQAIAAAEMMAQLFGVERVLVICPTSLKYQWQQEIRRVCDREVCVVGGQQPRRFAAFELDSFFKITNYDTIRADLDKINGWAPDLVILDEAQRIKNWETQTAVAVKRIDSPYAIVLTGTPLENRLEELVSIVQFVDQHRIGPTFRFLHHHQIVDESGRLVGYQNLEDIGKTLAPILIRRQKSTVLDELPQRLDKYYYVDMEPEQLAIHQSHQETVARLVTKWKRLGHLSEPDQRRLMTSLQTMRMVCDSTFLVDQETDHGCKAGELVGFLEEALEDPATKIVIFSQWRRMQQVVAKRLDRLVWDYVSFHGSIRADKRPEIVERFQSDPQCRILLATDAAGVGLNLQNASVIVNLDLPWNPAVLEQRVGRVHRIGQRNPVRVVSFVARESIEHGMVSLIHFKKALFDGVLDGGANDVFLGGDRLKVFMESVERVSGAIPGSSEAAESIRDQTGNGRRSENWRDVCRIAGKLLAELSTEGQSSDRRWIDRDETGQVQLVIPMPDAALLEEFRAALNRLLGPEAETPRGAE